MPKDIGGLSVPLLNIQQEPLSCSRESIRQEQHPYGLGRYIVGTTEGNTTDDLQGSRKIYYAAPVRSINLHDTNYRKIQYTQNEALRIATDCHKVSSIDHLHTEAEMLKVREHSVYYLHSIWLDAWNQEMYVTPSQKGLPLRDR